MKRLITTCVFFLSVLAVQAEEAPKQADGKDPELRTELLLRTKADQDARMAIVKWFSDHGLSGDGDTESISGEQHAEFEKLAGAIKKADSENTRWLKEIVENRGWPTRTLVSKDGASAAWLLVQHADADPRFQRNCLDRMVKLPKGEVSQANIAYLTDRVLLAEGKKQVYGTQFTTVDGKLQPRPLEDEANVDKLRAEVGLPTLAEYAKEMAKVYGGNVK
jgi:hypothetical protein